MAGGGSFRLWHRLCELEPSTRPRILHTFTSGGNDVVLSRRWKCGAADVAIVLTWTQPSLRARHPDGVDFEAEFGGQLVLTWRSRCVTTCHRRRPLARTTDRSRRIGDRPAAGRAVQSGSAAMQSRLPGKRQDRAHVLASDGHMSKGDVPFTVQSTSETNAAARRSLRVLVALRAGTLVFQFLLIGGVVFVLWTSRHAPAIRRRERAWSPVRGRCCA